MGNGLKFKYNGWPRSDKEMAEVTAGEYMGKNQPFHACSKRSALCLKISFLI